MTKPQIDNIVKRYPYLKPSIDKNELSVIKVYIGNRKYVFELTEEVKTICRTVEKVYGAEKNCWVKFIIKGMMNGETDKWMIGQMPVSRSKFYEFKEEYMEKVYDCCISLGLVTYEEVLSKEIL